IYAPDDSCGRVAHNPDSGSGSGYQFQREVNNQMNQLKFNSRALKTTSKGRLEIDPEAVLKTRKSQCKQQVLVDSMASKKFEIARDQCLRNGRLYEDPDFPANNQSIGPVTGLDLNRIEWKRPKEMYANADYVQDNIDRFDIQQGQLGNCWLMAVISSITNYPKLLDHIMSTDQSMKSKKYAGIFRFRFWQFGKWVEVIIDDRLPVFKGTNNLVFMHSSDAGEFWSPLLEKAYAKLRCGYAKLEGGVQAEAMEDFTGGLCETIDLKNPPPTLLEDMCIYNDTATMMGVSTISQVIEERTTTGLVKGHAYSVTGVNYVTYRGKKQYLVRLRNPWGNSVEWNKAFGDNSSEWKEVSAEDKKRLEITFASDGEFWMTWEDFLKEWTTLEICHLGLASLEEGENIRGKQKLEESIFTGKWTANVTAGGCMNNRDTFSMNPQFKIVVGSADKSSFVTIGLMQKDMRSTNDGKFLSIGFMIFQIPDSETGLLGRQFFATNKYTSMSKFVAAREVSLKVEDARVKAHFDRIQDKKGLINSTQLIEILNNSELKTTRKFTGFTKEMGRSLLALVDDDISGLLNWKEFQSLWEDCQLWKYIYEKIDEDNTGYLEPNEFREAISVAGFSVSNEVFEAIIKRYSAAGTGYTDFDDFVMCLSRLKNSIENMHSQPKTTDCQRLFTEDEFMQYSIYT
ncbi:hypothetical protein Ciccas_010117, partial [Cichlidogyrus casuarinus]